MSAQIMPQHGAAISSVCCMGHQKERRTDIFLRLVGLRMLSARSGNSKDRRRCEGYEAQAR